MNFTRSEAIIRNGRVWRGRPRPRKARSCEIACLELSSGRVA
jgi:hypothetical protein